MRRIVADKWIKRFAGIFSAKVFSYSLGLGLVPVFLALMPPEEYGLYALLAMLTTSLALVLGMGQSGNFLHCHAMGERRQAFIDSALTLAGGFIIVHAVVLVVVAYASGDGFGFYSLFFQRSLPVEFVWIVALLPSVLFLRQATNSLLSIHENYRVFNYFTLCNVSGIALLSIIAICVFPEATALARLVAALIADFSTTLLFFCFVRRKNLAEPFTCSPDLLKKCFYFGVPAFFSGVLGVVGSMLPATAIENFFDYTEVARYNLNLRVLAPVTLIVTSCQTILFAQIYKMGNESVVAKRYLQVGGLAIVAALLLSAVAGVLFHIIASGQIPMIPSDYASDLSVTLALAGLLAARGLTAILNNHARKLHLQWSAFFISAIVLTGQGVVLFWYASSGQLVEGLMYFALGEWFRVAILFAFLFYLRHFRIFAKVRRVLVA
jgi:hypothetical protein